MIKAVVAPVLTSLAYVLGMIVRAAPAAGGVLLVAYGAWLIFRPAGFLVLGAFLILADRRIP